MQNSNSMWKLTALAGAVGLGLLVIMQLKSSMEQTSPKTVEAKGQADLAKFRPLQELGKKKTSDPFDLDNDPPVNSRTTTKSRASKRLRDVADDLEINDELPNSTANRSRKSAQSLAEELDSLSEDQSEPIPVRRKSNIAESMLDSGDDPTLASDDSSGADPFGDTDKPTPIARKPSRREQAQELLLLARKLMDSGLLEEARLKAADADDLSVRFGPLEDSPEAVLADIARLETPTRTKTDLDSETISLAGNADKKSAVLDLNLDELDLDRAPVKRQSSRSLLADEDNLFADNPPEAPKGVKRIPDPPIPPAEELPGENSLDLSSLPDEFESSAKPMKSKPELNSVPSRLRPLATEFDDQTPEKIFGSGTLRPDAPRGPQRPELKIEKVAPPNAVLGKDLIYTIVIRNVGESVANQVVVEDQIPHGTSLSGTIPRAELSGKTLTWRIGSISPGETKDIQVKVVPVSEGQVGSVATVSFQAEIASRTTVSAPKISLRLNAPQQARLGDPVTVNYTITNNATVEATRVVLRSMIPDNLRLEGLTERDLEYDIGTLAPGKSETVKLPLATIRPGRAVNKAIITTDGVAAAEAQAEINVVGQLVGFTRHGPTSSFANKTLEFENRLTNHSMSATQNTIVVESLPKSVEFVSATNGGKFDSRLRTVTWQVSHLDPQQTLPLKIKLVAKTTGTHLGSVQINETGRKGHATDYQFKTIGAASLSLDFLDKAEAYSRGEEFTLRLVVKNKGSGEATNVALRIAVPEELQFVSLRGPVNHTKSGRTLVLEPIAEIGGQGTVNIELTFRAVANGDTTLQVEMQSDQFKKPISQEEPLVIFAGNVN